MTEREREHSGGGATESGRLLSFSFFSLTRSHKRKHFPCMWCQWHRVHYLACHHTLPTPPTPWRPARCCLVATVNNHMIQTFKALICSAASDSDSDVCMKAFCVPAIFVGFQIKAWFSIYTKANWTSSTKRDASRSDLSIHWFIYVEFAKYQEQPAQF